MKSPVSLTITESDPSTVDHFNVVVKLAGDNTQVGSKDYPITGNLTVAPVGSDDALASVSAGALVNFYVTEVAAGGARGPEQLVLGGPFTVTELPDGAEAITVQL